MDKETIENVINPHFSEELLQDVLNEMTRPQIRDILRNGLSDLLQEKSDLLAAARNVSEFNVLYNELEQTVTATPDQARKLTEAVSKTSQDDRVTLILMEDDDRKQTTDVLLTQLTQGNRVLLLTGMSPFEETAVLVETLTQIVADMSDSERHKLLRDIPLEERVALAAIPKALESMKDNGGAELLLNEIESIAKSITKEKEIKERHLEGLDPGVLVHYKNLKYMWEITKRKEPKPELDKNKVMRIFYHYREIGRILRKESNNNQDDRKCVISFTQDYNTLIISSVNNNDSVVEYRFGIHITDKMVNYVVYSDGTINIRVYFLRTAGLIDSKAGVVGAHLRLKPQWKEGRVTYGVTEQNQMIRFSISDDVLDILDL